MNTSPLTGLRVVEFPGVETLFIGKLFADLGATVTRLDPPAGDPARRYPPLVADAKGAKVSAVWLAYAIGRQHVALDPERPSPAREAQLDSADVVLHPYTGAEAERRGLSYEHLRRSNLALIVVALTPFGSEGPRAAWAASDLTQFAGGGYLYMTGSAEGRPIHPSAPVQTYLHGANHAFAAALLALRRRRLTGEGAFIDQSIRETGAWMLTHTYQHWDMQRINLRRQGAGRDMGARRRLRAVFPCADGHVVWMFTTGHLGSRSNTALVSWMAEAGMAPAWLRAIDWETADLLASEGDLPERLEAAFGAFFATKPGAELLDWAIAHGLMLAPMQTLAGIPDDLQLAARDAWREHDFPGFGPLRIPGPPVRIEGVRWEPAERLPVGSGPPNSWFAPPAARAARPLALPLSGVRVLDLGSTLAAPIVARYLGDFGAGVIKVESSSHPDTLRVGTPYAEGTGLDRSGYFGAYSAGKRSFALNLQAPGAHAVLRRLVERSDVLVENFAPGVMRRLGLTPEVLHAWNPRLVAASHSLQGQTGPRAPHRGYGQIASAMTGWYDLTGEEGGEPLGPYSAYTDFLSWPILLSAILVALEERDRTGQGQYIDHAQVESSLHFLAPLLLEQQITGRSRTRAGNRNDGFAPNDTFRVAGDDEWVAITARDDAEWASAAAVLGLRREPLLDTLPGRKLHEAALDVAIAAAVADRDANELVDALQAAGVPAHHVHKAEDLFADVQLQHRGLFRRLEHPVLGDHAVIMHSFKISGCEPGPWSAAPCLGEHTYDIARNELGLDDDTIAGLVAEGVLA